MKIVEFLKTYETGEMDIITQAVGAFRILEFQERVPDRLYPGGEIEDIPNDPSSPDALHEEVLTKYEKLKAILNIKVPFENRALSNLSFAMACHLQLPIGDKLKLLSMPKESERLLFVSEAIERALPLAVNAKENFSRSQKNGNSRPVAADPSK